MKRNRVPIKRVLKLSSVDSEYGHRLNNEYPLSIKYGILISDQETSYKRAKDFFFLQITMKVAVYIFPLITAFARFRSPYKGYEVMQARGDLHHLDNGKS